MKPILTLTTAIAGFLFLPQVTQAQHSPPDALRKTAAEWGCSADSVITGRAAHQLVADRLPDVKLKTACDLLIAFGVPDHIAEQQDDSVVWTYDHLAPARVTIVLMERLETWAVSDVRGLAASIM